MLILGTDKFLTHPVPDFKQICIGHAVREVIKSEDGNTFYKTHKSLHSERQSQTDSNIAFFIFLSLNIGI